MPCVIVENGEAPIVVPVPEELRAGLGEDDVEYWVPRS